MIENFLRAPHTPVEVAADGLRVIGVVGVVAAWVWWGVTAAGVVAFVLPAMVLPRFLGVRAGVDIVACVTVLVAAWSNVLDLYRSVAWWDIVVHTVATGMLALLVVLLLARFGVVPEPRRSRAGTVILTAVVGLALSALWEMVEWLGHTFITAEIFVAYDDTIGDMAVGGLGAVLAGFVLAAVPVLRADASR